MEYLTAPAQVIIVLPNNYTAVMRSRLPHALLFDLDFPDDAKHLCRVPLVVVSTVHHSILFAGAKPFPAAVTTPPSEVKSR